MRLLTLILALIPLGLLWLPFKNALAFFSEIDISAVMTMEWFPEYDAFGFGVPLVGSLILVACALPISIFLGWCICVQLHDNKTRWINSLVIPLLETWVSLPSVVLGVWAVSQIVPLVRFIEGSGYGLLTTVIGLTIFIVPVTSLLFYRSYQEYQLQYGHMERSLQVNFWQRTELYYKACKNAWMSTTVYTFCRLFGETMIVLMLSGNSLQIPTALTDGLRTLTATIALEMSYATDLHELSLFAMSALAIVIVAGCVAIKLRVSHVSS